MRGQLRFLRSKGYEVYLACSPGEGLDRALEAEDVQGIAVPIARELSPLKDLVALWKLYRTMQRVRPILTNVGTPKAGLLGGLAAWLSRVPCRVYTLRGLRWETASGLQRMLLIWADWVCCHCAHRVICVSHNLQSEAVAAGIVSRERTVVLGDGSSNGVNEAEFAPTDEMREKGRELRRNLGIEADAPVVGFVGRFTRDKGIQELYDAHKILQREFKNLRLLLLGDFEAGDPVPNQLRAALQTDPSVICPGFIEDPSAYYHVIDVLAHPSHREGFPNVVLEAQAAGKPVVGALATGTADAVLNGLTGFLVPVGDSTALSDALGTLVRNASMRTKMGDFGRSRVVDRFRSERIWEALAGEYRSLLSRKGLPVPESSAENGYVAAYSQGPAGS